MEKKSTPPPGQHLTPEQQRALATDKNISVTAGAGSGKTTILVERYLKIIIDERVDVRHLLAITFTEKAAAEMTERVSRILRERLEEPRYAQQHSRLLGLRERLNSAQISTIHAFCARVLREFAVTSGIDPDFNVLGELQQELMVNEAVDDIFSRLDDGTLESPYTPEEWKELLRQVPPKLLRQMLTTALQNRYEMRKLQEQLAEKSDDELVSDLRTTFFQALERRIDIAALHREVEPQLRRLSGIAVKRNELKDKGRAVFELLDDLLNTLEGDADKTRLWQQLINLALLLTTSNGTAISRPSALGTKAVLKGAYQGIIQLSGTLFPLSQFAAEYAATVPGRLDLLNLAIIRKVVFLYQLAEEQYRASKEERGVLDFDDLQLLTLTMLKEQPTVRNTLRNRYRYVMVDEFQDTNELQWELISRLGELQGELQADKFFVVGDPKQSIYGFRNADVRVFQQVKEHFARSQQNGNADSYSGNVVLQDSFRFLPSLNTLVNFLFEQVLGGDRENEFEVAYEELHTRRAGDAEAGHIEIAVLDDEALRKEKLSQEDYLAQTICRLLNLPSAGPQRDGEIPASQNVQVYHRQDGRETTREIRPGDIAVLIPRRTHLIELESKLRRYGIPFKTIGGVGFYRRQEIFDVYHLLRYLDNPGDNLALVAVLRSPFAGLSDAGLFYLSLERGETYREKLYRIRDFSSYPEKDREQLPLFREQLTRWEERRDRLSLSRLLNDIFEESFYRATVAAEWNGEQLLANLDKIVEMARDYEQGGFIALADFSDSLWQTIDLDPREGEAQIALEDEGTVKIMTIHQAKGLEFPVVFCPYLQQTPRGDYRKLRFDSDLGMAVKICDPRDGYREQQPFLYQLINFRQTQKQIAELKRLFYVAVTRARDRVYLVGSDARNALAKENCLSWAVRALGIDPVNGDTNQPLLINDRVPVHLVTEIATAKLAGAGAQHVAPSLQAVEETLDKAAEATETSTPLPLHLQPIADQPKGVTFSATQLLTFQSDPENYFRRYHLGFFESDYEFLKADQDPDSLSLLKGKIVHQILEDGLPETTEEILDKLESAFFQYEIFDREEQQKFKNEIPALLGPFLHTDFAQKIFSGAKSRVEISLTMQLNGDYFTGTLDRIVQNELGKWEVVDYKTNRVSAAEVEEAGEKYLVQMKSYALLMAQLFPDQERYPVTLYFLRPQKIFARRYSPEDVEQIKAEFIDLIAQIKKYYPFGERVPGE